MSKILFVEDELNSERILSLFGNHLTDEKEELLNSPKAKRREFIKEIFEKSPIIHVEYNFIEAIKTIESRFDEFSFFIIDRNLYASTQREDVKPEYNEDDIPKSLDVEVVKKCEGDYLFLLLLDKYLKYSNPRLLLENFYFLTAYSAEKENLKVEESLNKLWKFFPPNHVIEKDKPKMLEDFIQNKINKFEDLVIKSNHREVFEVFSKGYLDASFEKDLLSVLKVMNAQEPTEIKKSVCVLRYFFEVGILGRIIEVLRETVDVDSIKKQIPDDYHIKGYKVYIIDTLSNNYGGNIDPIKILRFLNGTTEKAYPFKSLTEEYFSNTNFLLTDSYYRIISDKVWKCSSGIAHGIKPTHYTLPILVNILLDFLIWFGDFMDNQTI